MPAQTNAMVAKINTLSRHLPNAKQAGATANHAITLGAANVGHKAPPLQHMCTQSHSTPDRRHGSDRHALARGSHLQGL